MLPQIRYLVVIFCVCIASTVAEASKASDKKLRQDLVGVWVSGPSGCSSSAPWIFKKGGRFESSGLDGQWRIYNDKLFLVGFDVPTEGGDADLKREDTIEGVWSTEYKIRFVGKRRFVLTPKKGKEIVLSFCRSVPKT